MRIGLPRLGRLASGDSEPGCALMQLNAKSHAREQRPQTGKQQWHKGSQAIRRELPVPRCARRDKATFGCVSRRAESVVEWGPDSAPSTGEAHMGALPRAGAHICTRGAGKRKTVQGEAENRLEGRKEGLPVRDKELRLTLRLRDPRGQEIPAATGPFTLAERGQAKPNSWQRKPDKFSQRSGPGF